MAFPVDAMPLDTRAGVLAAWHLVNHPLSRAMATPGEIVMARDRIQYAAVEFGMGMFPEPECELP